MQSRKLVLLIVAVAVMAGGWYTFRPERLFINKSVSETLEGATPNATASVQGMGTSAAVALSAGTFHNGSHETVGTASIYGVGGQRVLRLTNFHTSNGPDVHVYLVEAEDATDNDGVTKTHFIDLGSLKGNVGDQNYDVPADVDLSTHRAVTIWCKRFGVNFGTAPLMDQTVKTTMHEPMMDAGSPQVLRAGRFHNGSHKTSGMATIYRLSDGRRVLRFTEFETSNGPDVQVYLIAAGDATDNATVTQAGFVPVATLKGNAGDQNYELPADIDLDTYRAVTIWCRRFGVNFGTAPLAAPQS